MKKILLCDLVILKDICNSKCEYCLTSFDEYSQNSNCKLRNQTYEKGTALYNRINSIIDNVVESFEVAALKISGGEILLTKNIIQLLEERSKQFINVQLMTNGILLNHETINRMKKINNFHLQISLDSSNFDGNLYRNKNEVIHQKILKNIDDVINNNIPLEINCVLTNLSINYFIDFLNYLKRYSGKNVRIFPFPVRGNNIERFLPTAEQSIIIQRVIDNYSYYKDLLPPLKYLIELYAFLKNRSRSINCSIPFHTFQVFDYGECTPCPFWWTVNMGNVYEDKNVLVRNFRNMPAYRLLLSNVPKLEICKNCFVRNDILNLYMLDEITIDELSTIPFYNNEKIRSFVEEIKNNYIKQ